MALGTGENFKSIAKKLHFQFNHPSSEKLIKLLKDGGHGHQDLIKEVKLLPEKCLICIKRQKPPLRPVVCLPMASTFNEVLAVDLKAWGKYHFLVMVDLATRFCQATVVPNKAPSTIIKGLFKSWITLFGAPKKLLSDNGGEFNNKDVLTLGGKFNMKILTTAAESPWSNGVCERLNGILGERVAKILSESKCDLDLALAWAVSAQNALSNHSGFSPNQLVFSFNPAIPDVFNSEPPALEPAIPSEIVRQNLEALHQSRRDFVRRESDEKYKRALRCRVRPTRSDHLANGDNVFYKRNASDDWCGPGVIIGIDNKQFIVRHGGQIVRVHAARLAGAQAVISDEENVHHEEVEKETRDRACDLERLQHGVRENVISPKESTSTKCNGHECEEPDEPTVGQTVDETRDTPDNQTSDISEHGEDQVSGGDEREVVTDDWTGNRSRENRKSLNERSWRPGERFSGVDEVSGEYITGKIIDRAGKVKGRNKDLYNIERDNGWRGWFDFKCLKDISEIPDENEIVILFSSDTIDKAKDKEVQIWRDNGVYDEVDDEGQFRLSVRWVVTEKIKEGVTIIRARLVARGFEEYTEDLKKNSPTCDKESVRLLLALASINSWDCHTVDVKSAYLQGNKIEREVYLKPPPEFSNGKLWKLNKTIYGLCDAARAWYTRVKDELTALSVKICSLDKGLFMWYRNGQLEGIIVIYVDDFLWAGTTTFERCVINVLRTKFLIGSSSSKSFRYVGLNIVSKGEGIMVDQLQYAASLQTINISRARSSNKLSELSEIEKNEYRALVGQLNWLAANTRPDIGFDICELSVATKIATVGDLQKLNKLVDRVKKDSVKLHFPAMQDLQSCYIECYTDAAFGNLPDSGSQGGTVIFLNDGSGQRCPLFWQSKKLKRVVRSTLAAEASALAEGAERAIYIARKIEEMTKCTQMPIRCFVDNKSVVDALVSGKEVEGRLSRIDMAAIEEMVEKQQISVSWVGTSGQLADCLTKRGASTEKLREALYMDQ